MSGDPNLPGDSAADGDVTSRWREQSAEQPSPATDARIRAAAREAVRAEGGPSLPHAGRRGGRWSRLVPLAAAASVALLAIGLVRLIPRDEYQAIPVTPKAAGRRDATPEAALPAAPATTPAPRPVTAEIVDEAERSTATDASVSSQARESRAELHAAHEPAAAAANEVHRLDEPSPQPKREGPAAAPGVSAYAAPPVAATQAPAEAAPSASTTTITTTSARRATGADAAALLPDELARRVRDDAARRAAVDPATIRIVAVDPVMWFDTSLGCEAGAMAAPEMRVPGYVVSVEADDTTFRYHTDDRERIRICGDD
jgi:hypothetical protein